MAYTAAAAGESRPPAGRPAAARLEPAGIYKRLVILLRSLYSYVRVLPAYRLLRACKVGAPAWCPECIRRGQLQWWRDKCLKSHKLTRAVRRVRDAP